MKRSTRNNKNMKRSTRNNKNMKRSTRNNKRKYMKKGGKLTIKKRKSSRKIKSNKLYGGMMGRSLWGKGTTFNEQKKAMLKKINEKPFVQETQHDKGPEDLLRLDRGRGDHTVRPLSFLENAESKPNRYLVNGHLFTCITNECYSDQFLVRYTNLTTSFTKGLSGIKKTLAVAAGAGTKQFQLLECVRCSRTYTFAQSARLQLVKDKGQQDENSKEFGLYFLKSEMFELKNRYLNELTRFAEEQFKKDDPKAIIKIIEADSLSKTPVMGIDNYFNNLFDLFQEKTELLYENKKALRQAKKALEKSKKKDQVGASTTVELHKENIETLDKEIENLRTQLIKITKSYDDLFNAVSMTKEQVKYYIINIMQSVLSQQDIEGKAMDAANILDKITEPVIPTPEEKAKEEYLQRRLEAIGATQPTLDAAARRAAAPTAGGTGGSGGADIFDIGPTISAPRPGSQMLPGAGGQRGQGMADILATSTGHRRAAQEQARHGLQMDVVVPPSARPGQTLMVQAPTGQQVSVTIPDNARPGDSIRVAVPQQQPPAVAAARHQRLPSEYTLEGELDVGGQRGPAALQHQREGKGGARAEEIVPFYEQQPDIPATAKDEALAQQLQAEYDERQQQQQQQQQLHQSLEIGGEEKQTSRRSKPPPPGTPAEDEALAQQLQAEYDERQQQQQQQQQLHQSLEIGGEEKQTSRRSKPQPPGTPRRSLSPEQRSLVSAAIRGAI